jgi:polysaccharide export outer membrane protein
VRVRVEKQLLSNISIKKLIFFVTVKLAGSVIQSMGNRRSWYKSLPKEHVNIMEAIANAGDIAITGNRKAVTIMRKRQQVLKHLDLTECVMKSPYFYLQPNDYIYIKPLKQKSWGTGKNNY